jgi:hypothetical protein
MKATPKQARGERGAMKHKFSCPTHPDVNSDTMWGCPDCIVELRRKLGLAEQRIEYARRLIERIGTTEADRFHTVADAEYWLKKLRDNQ